MSALAKFENRVAIEKESMLSDGMDEPLAYSDSPGPHWWHKNLYTRYISFEETPVSNMKWVCFAKKYHFCVDSQELS